MQWAFALFPWCLCAFAAGWMLRTGARSRGAWLLDALACANVAAFAFLSGAWAFTSHYLSYAAPLLFIAAFVYSLRRMKRREDRSSNRVGAGRLVFPATLLAVFGVLNILALGARVAPAGGIDVRFPLATGSYYVLQGGDSVVTNPFHVASGAPLALDIVKLTALGNRADGVAPRALEAYAIFGDPVLSPCDGVVARVRDGVADNPPAHPDPANGGGNQVVVRCAGAEIRLVHLRRGSVAVAPGLAVKAGQLLGRVGNSGHSLEPHLHIDARVGASPRALVFGGRFLSAGDVVR